VASEFLIVFAVTGSVWIPTITTPLCIFVHTGLHYLIERTCK
jgi:hypothetical protein